MTHLQRETGRAAFGTQRIEDSEREKDETEAG